MMSRFRIRAARTRTLRSTWITTVAVFVAMIAAVGAIALLGMRHQRIEFSATAGELQVTTEAMVALERAMVDVFEPTFSYVYRLGGNEQKTAAAWERYVERSHDVAQAFDAASSALGSAGSAELAQAREHWFAVDAAVRSSHKDVTDAELFATFASGAEDPFVDSVWEPYDRVDRELAAARQATVASLGDLIEGADRTGKLVGTFVFWSLVVAIGLALVTARRMSRRVLHPLAELGRAAESMHDTDQGEPVKVPHAVAEVRELARIVNETSITMRNHQALLRTQARTDSMTALPNRDGFTEALHSMLDDADREQVAVLFIDLDDFKEVNDTLGHAAGDEVLRVVALRLKAATRGGEVAARLGGDEFAVAFDLGSDPTSAIAVAERVRLAITGPVDIDGHHAAVGCSIGIVVSATDATSADADELLGNADFAMYMAKSQGKNRYELYSLRMHTEVLARMELGRDLTEALQRDQFVLYYQPVLDLPSRELLGFEALIRWQHPTRGLIAPDAFIGLAEDSGAIVEIGAWVLDRACAELANMHTRDPQLTMSVNVSPRELVMPGFVDGVVGSLERYDIAPQHLVIEITEETAMTNTEVGANAIGALRAHGVHIALDDFGTGYSSLRYLGDLPVNVIKIDRSFVSGRDPHSTSTLESIVHLAQRLGLFVVAEGIEDEEDLARLARFGHIAGQGYHFARPMPAAEAHALVQRSTSHALVTDR
jgi:diguanylate cyclase (GGDEF)-like protein